jgi:hypothetical protein
MTAGDVDLWADTFPHQLIPRILDLVWQTWESFSKPLPNDREVPITRRFKRALIDAKDYRRLPIRIERELVEDDPFSGEELGRIDLKISPAQSAREQVFFAFECKRLNAVENSRRRTLASEYVLQGMMRFITGQYAASMHHGGMIGYVLDGHCDEAVLFVENGIRRQQAQLRLRGASELGNSSLCPDKRLIRETFHALPRPFVLHHLFLGCSPVTADSTLQEDADD